MKKLDINDLKKYAVKVRKHIIDEVYSAASGHPGGSLSCTDILTALYFSEMRVESKQPAWEDRDRFEGHPSMRYVPGVDMSTGSLGQGISAAVGMAMAGKMDKKDYRVYALLGDGELQEGEVWEAFMAAAHYKLDNLTAFLDHNGLQIDGKITEVMSPEPVADKFEAFGWNVMRTDGHDIEKIIEAIKEAGEYKGKPTIIIAETIKGKGVSYMENQAGWHGSAPNKEQRDQAMAELDKVLAELEVE